MAYNISAATSPTPTTTTTTAITQSPPSSTNIMDFWHVLAHRAPVFVWPVKFCVAMTAVTYVLSILTGNVSQVDRVWTFLPTIYTVYYALLPLWPTIPPTFLFPHTLDTLPASLKETYSPRALLMASLVVSTSYSSYSLSSTTPR